MREHMGHVLMTCKNFLQRKVFRYFGEILNVLALIGETLMCLESVAKQESGEQKSIEDSLDLLKVVGKTSKIFLSNGRESHDGIYQNPPTKQTQAMEILPWKKNKPNGRIGLFVLRGAFDYRMTSQPTPPDILHQEIRPY